MKRGILCYTKESSMWCMGYSSDKEYNFHLIMVAHCLL